MALAFHMQHQQQTQWCWAAVATSTSLFFDSNSQWTQCTLVNAELGQSTCCNNGSTSACNRPWYLDRALGRTGNLSSLTGSAEPFATIQQQNGQGRPLGARIGWSGGGGHFVMLTGTGNNQTLTVQDPWYGTSTSTYNSFRSHYQGNGTWTHSYFTQA